jgi:hypothetical protein
MVVDWRGESERKRAASKLETMRTIVTIMLNGDPMPQILMHIIRFVMPSRSRPGASLPNQDHLLLELARRIVFGAYLIEEIKQLLRQR